MGDAGPALEGLSKAFYNPETLDILPYRHNYTPDGASAITAYFIPAYSIISNSALTDHRGYTDPEIGRQYYLTIRMKKAADPKALLIISAEYCFTPQEAFALEGENIFNTELLAEQLSLINLFKAGPRIEVGDLDYTFKNNVHKEDNIDKVKFKESPTGKVHILELPVLDKTGEVPRDLYIAGIDGIDLGLEDTSINTADPSNFCVVVMKRSFGLGEPIPVCLYKDRPKTLKEAHMTCLKILLYYNCQAVLESTRISILGFFRERRCENKYLMRRPRATQTDILRGMSRQFGSPATETVIKHLLELISLYIDEYAHNIWFPEMLEELIRYSYENKRKFDIVASLGMAMLGNEELMGVAPKDLDEASKVIPLIGYWTDEHGYKHKGTIPSMMTDELKNRIKAGFHNDYQGPRVSSRRFDPDYLL